MNGAAQAVLDERGCRKIHEAALSLLEEVGCAILDPEALALLKANGAQVDGERARFGEALVERARSTAPARYTVAGRRPELDLHVGLGEPAVLASASGPPFVLSGGEYRTGTLADLTTAVRLAHLSAYQHLIHLLNRGRSPTSRRPYGSRTSRRTSTCSATASSPTTCRRSGGPRWSPTCTPPRATRTAATR